MMDKQQLLECFAELNKQLAAMGIKGEICLYGGAVMCLAFDARPNTKDVDAVFKPAAKIRKAAEKVAAIKHLREDWLNDAVKDFVVKHKQEKFLAYSHLKIYLPQPHYLLAMKLLAARAEGTDREDILFLAKKLGLKKPQQVLAVIEQYYPHHRIKPATQFLVEELFA